MRRCHFNDTYASQGPRLRFPVAGSSIISPVPPTSTDGEFNCRALTAFDLAPSHDTNASAGPLQSDVEATFQDLARLENRP